MKTLLAAAALALLAGCTTGDVATLRQLTVEDGARYVDENHQRRRDIRAKLYSMEDEVIRKCEERVRRLDSVIDSEAALKALKGLDWCFKFLQQSYPDLATFKAIREGREQVNNLRKPAP